MNTSNPVTWGSAIIGLVTAAIGMLNQFGHPLTQGQEGAIMTFMGAVIVAGGLLLHSTVIPKGKAQEKIDQAFAAPPDTPAELKPKA